MIKILIENFDKHNDIIFIEKEGQNIWGVMGIMQYEDDMEYFGLNVVLKDMDGRKGYVVSKDVDKELLYLETKRFIEDHDLENRNCF